MPGSKPSSKRQHDVSVEQLSKDIHTGPYVIVKRKPTPQVTRQWVAGVLTSLFLVVASTGCVVLFVQRPVPVLVAFTLLALVLTAYFKTVTAKPQPTSHYVPPCSPEERDAAIARAVFAKERGFKVVDVGYPARYCLECGAFRPPRPYHCKLCGCCIPGKDHHCPYIGQCVGTHNARSFFQLLLFLPLTCLSFMTIHLMAIALCIRTELALLARCVLLLFSVANVLFLLVTAVVSCRSTRFDVQCFCSWTTSASFSGTSRRWRTSST